MNTTPITEAMNNVAPPPVTKLARKLGKRRPKPVPVHDDPRAELRRLVREHKRMTKTAVAWDASIRDRKMLDDNFKPTGEIVKNNFPEAVKADIQNACKGLVAEAKSLERAMLIQLAKEPIFKHFLSKVYGFGPVANSYLVAMVRIDRCVKPSQLWRYCGNACDSKTGKREIRSGAPKYGPNGNINDGAGGTYNDELKTRIWQAMTSMWKCRGKRSVERPNGTTSKYLERWENAVHSRKTMGRELGAHHAGRRKATDLFLEDLYIMWRTIEGLPVWPDLYSVRRGFFHGGKPCANDGRVLTLEEALSTIGDIGPRNRSTPFVKAGDEDESEDPVSDDIFDAATGEA